MAGVARTMIPPGVDGTLSDGLATFCVPSSEGSWSGMNVGAGWRVMPGTGWTIRVEGEEVGV